jgi:hypothetical protein
MDSPTAAVAAVFHLDLMPLGRPREDLHTVAGDQHGVLELRAEAAVRRHRFPLRPAVASFRALHYLRAGFRARARPARSTCSRAARRLRPLPPGPASCASACRRSGPPALRRPRTEPLAPGPASRTPARARARPDAWRCWARRSPAPLPAPRLYCAPTPCARTASSEEKQQPVNQGKNSRKRGILLELPPVEEG